MAPGPTASRCDIRLEVGDVRDVLAPRYVLNGDGAARAIAFLACDAARYITDQSIVVDGGWPTS